MLINVPMSSASKYFLLFTICAGLVFLSMEQSNSRKETVKGGSITYDVYSALLSDPPLSHADGNQKYVIVDTTLPREEMEPPTDCRFFAENHPESQRQIEASIKRQGQTRFVLQRKLNLPKPYVLISEGRAAAFPGWGAKLTNADDVATFGGVQDVIRLSNVFFDKDQNFAMVYMSAKCGRALCGAFGWQLLVKLPNGHWKLDERAGCGSSMASGRSDVTLSSLIGSILS